MKLETLPVKDLQFHHGNTRQHEETDIAAIARSLKEFGQQKPIVVDERNVVIAGNGTLAAAQVLEWETLKAVRTTLDERNKLAFSIADNRTAELSEWDYPILKDALVELDTGDFDLTVTGWSKKELENLMTFVPEGGPDETEPIPDPPKNPVTKPGELVVLGDHRLICGDCTDKQTVERVMEGEKADMVFTDPPYGVNYEGGHFHSGDVNIKRPREKLKSDDTTAIYSKFLPVMLKYLDGPGYMWFADTLGYKIYQALAENHCEIHALIIWHKINAKYAAMNAQYKQRHELCIYFKPKGSTLRWKGPTDECTLWELKRDAVNEYHPTQKPVELAERAINNHDAETVLDCFGGSGSTLIACEKTGRKCRMIEIEPAYCDVIIERWQNYTGRKAER